MAVSAATLAGTRTGLSDESLDDLRARERGAVLTPSDPGYAEVRPPFNAMHTGRPAVVIRCAGTADVIDAVRFARERGLLVAVRGGGHSVAGLSVQDGGVLIDLSPMRGVEVDVARRVAHVQGGALWADVDRETQAFGLVTPGGVVSDTGVAGLTLGGGYGWLRRRYGLSSDNVLSARVVCADGTVRTASAATNPDLYWAIRGGGGNFGVVTSFAFRLHELGPIVPFVGAFYPIDEDAGRVLRGWRDYVSGVPDEITATVVTITLPADPALPEAVHDRACLLVGGLYAGQDLGRDVDEGMHVLGPLRELGSPLADISGPVPYLAVQSGFDALFPRNQFQAYWKSQYLDRLTDEAIDVIVGHARQRPAPMCLVNVFHMGGAINRVGTEETAFPERTASFMVSIDGMWSDQAANAENIAWVRAAWQDIKRYGTGAGYLNFTGRADEAFDAGVDSAFGRNLARLARIKAAYDPENFFRLNNNIPPAP